jgi:hypothetical protein
VEDGLVRVAALLILVVAFAGCSDEHFEKDGVSFAETRQDITTCQAEVDRVFVNTWPSEVRKCLAEKGYALR